LFLITDAQSKPLQLDGGLQFTCCKELQFHMTLNTILVSHNHMLSLESQMICSYHPIGVVS